MTVEIIHSTEVYLFIIWIVFSILIIQARDKMLLSLGLVLYFLSWLWLFNTYSFFRYIPFAALSVFISFAAIMLALREKRGE